jgi:hypothetical protein
LLVIATISLSTAGVQARGNVQSTARYWDPVTVLHPEEQKMAVAKLEKQQVIGALKATGSSDPDVLYARKEELLAESRKMKLLGIFPIIVGVAMSLTVIGAVVGIPVILFGLFVKKRIRTNIETAESALAEYLASIGGRTQAATA